MFSVGMLSVDCQCQFYGMIHDSFRRLCSRCSVIGVGAGQGLAVQLETLRLVCGHMLTAAIVPLRVVVMCVQGRTYPITLYYTAQPEDSYLDAALNAVLQVSRRQRHCKYKHSTQLKRRSTGFPSRGSCCFLVTWVCLTFRTACPAWVCTTSSCCGCRPAAHQVHSEEAAGDILVFLTGQVRGQGWCMQLPPSPALGVSPGILHPRHVCSGCPLFQLLADRIRLHTSLSVLCSFSAERTLQDEIESTERLLSDRASNLPPSGVSGQRLMAASIYASMPPEQQMKVRGKKASCKLPHAEQMAMGTGKGAKGITESWGSAPFRAGCSRVGVPVRPWWVM